MALPDKVKKLDEHIAEAVRAAVKGIREDLGQRLERNNEEMRSQLEQIEAALPATFVDASEITPIAEEASEVSRQAAFGELREGMAAIDGTRSQAGILGALLEQAGRFASRTALFLTRKDEAVGWGSFGFNDSPQDLSELTVSYEGSWATLASSGGALRLPTSDSATISSFLESEVPAEAVLIPIVLRDRLAAALYADRVEDGPALHTDAIQALTYVAAQAIEVLPFRERSATATLHMAEEGGAQESQPLEAWDASTTSGVTPATAAISLKDVGDITAEEAPEEASEVEEAATADAVKEDVTAEAVAELDETEDLPSVEAEPSVEPEPEPEIDPDDEPTVIEVDAFELEDDEDETEVGSADEEDEGDEPEVAEPEAPAAIGFDSPADGNATIRLEALPEIPTLTPEPAPVEEPEEAEVKTADTLEAEIENIRAATEAQAPEEIAVEPTPQVEELLSPVDSPEPPTVEPDFDISEDETVLLDRDRLLSQPPPARFDAPADPPPPPAVPPPAPAPEPDRSGRTSAEVTPPTDLDGPGWAFSAQGDAEEEQEDGPLHDEARRLARLLVSEIRLYNEEQIEEGRRNRDIYQRVREDIERSRQIYEERVDERVARSTDYFQDELVEILAGGDPSALGA